MEVALHSPCNNRGELLVFAILCAAMFRIANRLDFKTQNAEHFAV